MTIRLRHIGLAGVLVIAAGLALFGDKSPRSGIAEPADRPALPARAASGIPPSPATPKTAQNKMVTEPLIPALLPRDTLIGGTHNIDYALFTSQTWVPPPPPPSKPVPAPPPPPPKAPPLPFTFFGKQMVGGVQEVFIANGNEVYVVREKTVIDDKYRVDSIKPSMLTLTYLPLNQVQTLVIGGSD